MPEAPSPLSAAARRYLKACAHDLHPVVRLGPGGLSERVLSEVDRALERHELIKVRLAGDRDERRRQAAALASTLAGHAVTTIGHVVILYRARADPQARAIRLPDGGRS